jgi:ABC-type polysaccharide/polyol phosphate transport system ATPase subunit
MTALKASSVTKTYRIGVGRARIREMLPWPADAAVAKMMPKWWQRDTFNALEDVTFELETGGSVGLVGHNGAGKTTLLKVVAGVTAPTSGTIVKKGNVAALIDVLVGFHPDLTGKENTYLLGAVYGFSRRDMNRRLDRVLEFAEIDNLAETPVKRYSSGMMARLGFGILAALDMDTLLVDEVLTVGDAGFQKKCIDWMGDYREQGGTLMFVSHNLALVRSMTDRVIWLDHGKVMDDGPTGDVLARYATAMEQRNVTSPVRRMGKARKEMVQRGLDRWGAGGAGIESVHVQPPAPGAQAWTVEVAYNAPEVREAVFAVGFIDESGREVGGAASPPLTLPATNGTVTCTIEPLPLRPGIYFPVVAIMTPDGTVRDRWQLDRAVIVEASKEDLFSDGLGPMKVPATWTGERSQAVSVIGDGRR